MLPLLVTWLIRYGHVLAGAIWVGGYALMVLVLIPRLARPANETLLGVTIGVMRVLSYAGTATIVFGLILVWRTRGYATIMRGGEWSGIIITCLVIAIALLGMGDSALRPALRNMAQTGDGGRARRLAWIGFILTIIAIGLMTRALYAVS